MTITTSLPDLNIRHATVEDCQTILGFIVELAIYEKLEHEVVATTATLEETLFGATQYAQCIIAEYQSKPVGYALFFNNFSTFTGRPGIYLEDLYVQPKMRGKGFGKNLLAYLAKLAVDSNFTRVEWSVLDWNKPAIDFYRSIGAQPMEGWTAQRLDGDQLQAFAKEFK
jgi:GNAT superfamily N-acetyltransferase